MPTVQLAQVKPGDKLIQDVQTPLGSVLFHKGKVIMPREVEILHAFLVPEVVIAAREDVVDEPELIAAPADEPIKEVTFFQKEYDQLFAFLKKVYHQNTTGHSFPILEIRTRLERLLHHIKEYNVLTYKPVIASSEDYLYHNSVMSALTSYQLAQWIGFPKKDWIPVSLAGLFHDIGNIRVDKSILNKPTALKPNEVEEMRQHTVYGYQFLKAVPAINEGVKLAALQHHEKVDGSGYPLGITGDKIHPYARIVGIGDIYHAMTLKRSYRNPVSPYLVLEQIQQESFGKLDPAIVQIFIEKATRFHNGIVVTLSDNRIGEIVFTDRNHPTRPWVSVNGTIINLATERHLHIQGIING